MKSEKKLIKKLSDTSSSPYICSGCMLFDYFFIKTAILFFIIDNSKKFLQSLNSFLIMSCKCLGLLSTLGKSLSSFFHI